jgi:hypothetical protein
MNHAFGPTSEYLYLAFIAGIVSVGLNPRSVVQLPANRSRLDRLFPLIAECAYSLHDLSYVTLSRTRFRVPRFNMPFELGLAVAVSLQYPDRHQVMLFDAVRYRLAQSLSDVGGFDAYIHRGRGDGVLEGVLDVFTAVPDRPLDAVSDLRWVCRNLGRFRREQLARTPDVFTAHPFAALVLAARRLVDTRSH